MHSYMAADLPEVATVAGGQRRQATLLAPLKLPLKLIQYAPP
jgi:hypothetical protein